MFGFKMGPISALPALKHEFKENILGTVVLMILRSNIHQKDAILLFASTFQVQRRFVSGVV